MHYFAQIIYLLLLAWLVCKSSHSETLVRYWKLYMSSIIWRTWSRWFQTWHAWQKIKKDIWHVYFLGTEHQSNCVGTTPMYLYIIMDCMHCTYKTNKMPLLDIMGCLIAFMKKEGAEDYIWALQNFRMSICCYCLWLGVGSNECTHLLCVSKCKEYFKVEKEWDSFLSTWNAIEEAWKLLELLYI